jgi:DNA replication and repair protein RecF
MSISQLSLTNFRALKSTTIDLHPAVNFITGDNGSGKTSLLEAIHVICQGSSFRTNQLKHCINLDSDQLLLFSRFSDYKVGLSKSDTKLDIRLNGQPVKRRSELVTRTPINIFDAKSFDLITGPPELRRKYIDWCLFHVEQSYAGYWSQFKHALKQRNSILKSRQNLDMLDYWDKYLLEPSLVIHRFRQQYTQLVSTLLADTISGLLGEIDLTFEYEKGWPNDMELNQALSISRNRDIKSGFTNCGIHRDNLKVMTQGIPVTQVLSRGQLKKLCIAFQIVLLKIVKQNSSRPVILLVDDIGSELDLKSQKNVFQQLLEIEVQLFITNIENEIPQPLKSKEFKMFHVEHGIIATRKNS